MRILELVAALAVLGASAAAAAGHVFVDANTKARVFLDGEMLGMTPISLRDIAGGNHVMRLQDARTGKTQVYNFYVSRKVTIEKDIKATFNPNDPAELVVESGFNAATGERGYRYEEPGYRYAPASRARSYHVHRHNRDKVRIRNVSLGVGTLGLLTGKDALTGLGFGAALVNEIANK